MLLQQSHEFWVIILIPIYETNFLPSYLMKIQALFLDLASGLRMSGAVVAAALWGRREEECLAVTNAPDKTICK